MSALPGREFLGSGWRFPPRVDASGALTWASGEDNVAQSVWIILATARGEREMRPTFGCGLQETVFAPNSPASRAELADRARQALIEWEPRIEVLDIEVSSPDEPNLQLIEVEYRIRSTNTVQNLVYPFFTQEGVPA
jgi:Bacteriophage baseplate protein W